ncbi:DUF5916 domain-containing protein [Sediminicola sp. 1XM1-17]|uniref:DUF5916 domain-containing protein n=1 Tax=Sediminicola sp. 1XM1-17 TaxID=3127702 RepID=UPI0030784451
MLKQNLFLFTLLCTTFVYAQTTSSAIAKRSYTTHVVGEDEAPTVDGVLDDAAWNESEWAGDFIEWRPDENTPPTFATRFKIVYDAKHLYIGIQAFDKAPDSIEKRLSRRDGFQGDIVEVNIDSYLDKRTGFSFSVSAAGVKGDEFISENGNNWDSSWNPIWYTKTNIDGEGWTAELKIPFSQLRFGKSQEQVWGLQVQRILFRKEERSVWQRVPRDAPGWVSEFGELRGLIDIEPQRQLEIQPFTVAKLDTYPKEVGNPFRDGSDTQLNGGVDAKIGITNNLTLDLTINPDFGQVEADPGAIALDGFQIFFQEQRPFFVENKNIFDYRFANNQDNVFYSRRIGRSPQGRATVGNGEYVQQPKNTTILGAAKFSGKTKNGWSLGVLESVTGKMFAEINNSGQERKELVEPLTNYLVARAQKDFNERNSYVGGIFTATNRDLEPGLDFLRQAAYSGGVDFRHSWKDRKYFVEGNMVASHVLGSEESIRATQESITHLFQRVDAGHVEVDANRTSLTGTGGRLEGGKAGGGHWLYNSGVSWKSPELELNDIGFLRQADEVRQYSSVSWRTIKPLEKFRNIYIGVSQLSTYDFEGNFNRLQYDLNSEFVFRNNWWAEFGAAHKPRIFITSFLRGGPRWRFSEENFEYFFFGSDRRKKLNFVLGQVYSQAKQDNFSFQRYVARLNYQPFNALSFYLETELEKNPNKTQYVTETSFDDTPRYITANIVQDTWATTLRVNYTINPNLTIQYYGQPFISRGRYTDFNYVNNPIAKDLGERVTVYDDNQISKDNGFYNVDEDRNGTIDYNIGDPDFSFVQFRSNLVLRWEYIPGSEIFLVWSQGVTGLGDPRETLGRSLDRQILNEKLDNTFLLKATYRFAK